jgi:hypothetical protein
MELDSRTPPATPPSVLNARALVGDSCYASGREKNRQGDEAGRHPRSAMPGGEHRAGECHAEDGRDHRRVHHPRRAEEQRHRGDALCFEPEKADSDEEHRPVGRAKSRCARDRTRNGPGDDRPARVRQDPTMPFTDRLARLRSLNRRPARVRRSSWWTSARPTRSSRCWCCC